MQFAQIPGFELLKATLIHSIENGKIAHAQLFAGQSGSAALPIALAYATYLNCTTRSATDSCGQCPSCVKYNKLAHPDLNFVFPVATSKEVTEPSSVAYIKHFRRFVAEQPFGGPSEWGAFFGAENKQLNIAVSEARFIISALSLNPYEAVWKVMLIWLPEYMNIGAANALLKVLEEPNASTLFLLVTEGKDKLLPTILSRVQSITIPPFENNSIEHYLLSNLHASEQEAKTIAMLANGSIAEAKRLLAEDTSIYFELFSGWMRACYSHKYADILGQTEVFAKIGREGQKGFFQYCLSMLREALLAHEKVDALVRLPAQESAFVEKFSTFINATNMPEITEQLGRAWTHIERNGNPKIIFFDTSLYLCHLLRLQDEIMLGA
jgi:DNA polymerase-3 subunit delta'